MSNFIHREVRRTCLCTSGSTVEALQCRLTGVHSWRDKDVSTDSIRFHRSQGWADCVKFESEIQTTCCGVKGRSKGRISRRSHTHQPAHNRDARRTIKLFIITCILNHVYIARCSRNMEWCSEHSTCRTSLGRVYLIDRQRVSRTM